MYYFAYGSNLSSLRLKQRVPSAKLLTTGKLNQHKLLFHKIGRDGSAKCDAYFTGQENDLLYGALYKIDPKQRTYLDQAEGLGNGYEIKPVTIADTESGNTIEAFTYFATRIATDIRPFHWYVKHVLFGAREHCFPTAYIETITVIASIEDKDINRANKELEIYSTDLQF